MHNRQHKLIKTELIFILFFFSTSVQTTGCNAADVREKRRARARSFARKRIGMKTNKINRSRSLVSLAARTQPNVCPHHIVLVVCRTLK